MIKIFKLKKVRFSLEWFIECGVGWIGKNYDYNRKKDI